jgi:hypothetical protein
MSIIKTLTAAMVVSAIVMGPVAAIAGKRGQESDPQTADAVSTQLTSTEVENLVFMREEEKLARDVYLTLYDAWGLGVFTNIADSEQTHTDSVKAMIDKYQLQDPVVDDSIGVFINQDLAVLYQAMVIRGSQSSLDALYVGAMIEEVDMVDLQRAIDETARADIRQLYENLMTGSRNHLRAYVGLIEDQGIVYEAQFLSQEEVDAIVDSPVERGGRR